MIEIVHNLDEVLCPVNLPHHQNHLSSQGWWQPLEFHPRLSSVEHLWSPHHQQLQSTFSPHLNLLSIYVSSQESSSNYYANKPRDLSTILSSRLTMRGYNPVQTYSTPICSAVELSVIYIPPHTTTTLSLYDQPNNLYWSKTSTRATFAILPNIWTYGDQYTYLGKRKYKMYGFTSCRVANTWTHNMQKRVSSAIVPVIFDRRWSAIDMEKQSL